MVFLGTGGGRFVITKQLRATGGIILELDGQVIHIDPGPGALVRAVERGVDLSRVTAVAVSHCHPDHYADAELVIEAMTAGATKRRGALIGSIHSILGGDDYRAAVSPYHLRALAEHHAMAPGETVRIGRVRATATPTVHGDPGGIGFVFRGSETIGYASDGSYYDGQEKLFARCDYLVMNVLRPRGNTWPKHMNTDQAARLAALAKPKTAIITHFGILMLKAGPEREAAYMTEKSGVRTIAAVDGMVITAGVAEGSGGSIGSIIRPQSKALLPNP